MILKMSAIHNGSFIKACEIGGPPFIVGSYIYLKIREIVKIENQSFFVAREATKEEYLDFAKRANCYDSAIKHTTDWYYELTTD